MSALITIEVTANDVKYRREVEPRLLLSDFLRQDLGLTGTHVGCEHGVCGACTILFDGEPARSCIMFAVQADGTTSAPSKGWRRPDGALNPLQAAFRDAHGLQCGFCTPGILMTLTAFLRDHPAPERSRRSATRCRPISAAAPATSTSSRRSGRASEDPLP